MRAGRTTDALDARLVRGFRSQIVPRTASEEPTVPMCSIVGANVGPTALHPPRCAATLSDVGAAHLQRSVQAMEAPHRITIRTRRLTRTVSKCLTMCACDAGGRTHHRRRRARRTQRAHGGPCGHHVAAGSTLRARGCPYAGSVSAHSTTPACGLERSRRSHRASTALPAACGRGGRHVSAGVARHTRARDACTSSGGEGAGCT